MLALAHEGCLEDCDDYALVMHDWSRLNYMHHQSKIDRLQMTHRGDIGYELQSSLLVTDRDGVSICTPAQNLATRDGVLSTRTEQVLAHDKHLHELTQRIAWLEQQGFGKPLFHVVDREADSVGHLRQWQAGGHLWLVRVKANSTAHYEGRPRSMSEIGSGLTFSAVRTVQHKGKPATQWLSETAVVLTRTAKPSAKNPQARRALRQSGEPLPARLIISQIRDADDRLLAEWYLLSNLEASVRVNGWRFGITGAGVSSPTSNCSKRALISWKAGSRKSVTPCSNGF
ncbi:hypothetical protein ACYZUD_27640 [Pseudomonas sp. XS1P51]